MAGDLEFVEYVVAVVCDNKLYVEPTDAGRVLTAASRCWRQQPGPH